MERPVAWFLTLAMGVAGYWIIGGLDAKYVLAVWLVIRCHEQVAELVRIEKNKP